jgi:CubicO group peptidase (beta-lactamase class C family)
MSRLSLLCLLVLAIAARAGDSTVAQLDAIFSPLAGARSPGLAVLVRQNGRTIFERGYGVRDLRTMAPIDAGTDFRLASFTKQFTALAAMLLVHDGKLRYESTLTDVFPGFPAYGRTITIRHLLTHTSGLPDYEELMEAFEKSKGPTWTPTHQIQDGEVLDLLRRQTHGKFAPGTSWSYSNSGYVVLGLAVAKVSGEPFERFLHDRIFEPLQMRHTLVYVNGANTVPDRAYGHTGQRGEFVEADQSATSATQGDGGVYSNLEDLAKWDDALRTGRLLKREEMRAALVPVKLLDGSAPSWPSDPGGDNLAPGKPVSYGFGWFLDPYAGRARMWHSGSTSGFRTAIERFPGEGLSIIVLSNRTDLDAPALALKSADVLLGKR